uniref:Receptor-type tyrosine-protein phosphatase H n=1 Tax=Schistocephalus solidus TaxID=70667 RepID=A0A0X3Q461_SCHSO
MIKLKLFSIFAIIVVWSEAKNDTDEFNPKNPTAKVQSARSIRLRWQAAEKSDRSPTIYVIACPATEKVTFYTKRTSYILENLQPGTKYWCTIRSLSRLGKWFKPGVAITVRTWDSVARNPRNLRAVVQNETCLLLTWKASKISDRKPALYTIVVNSDKEKKKHYNFGDVICCKEP